MMCASSTKTVLIYFIKELCDTKRMPLLPIVADLKVRATYHSVRSAGL
jgi:hypothetical protein